ncbi:MAG: hypothetical protein FJZ04_01990, partial [Candidatus Moranbacteria bacterium]|nr:hypothetical protein [Candidatus Moranbacteria bacterium]
LEKRRQALSRNQRQNQNVNSNDNLDREMPDNSNNNNNAIISNNNANISPNNANSNNSNQNNNSNINANGNANSNENFFTFAIIGDTQNFEEDEGKTLTKAASNIKIAKPDIVLAVGDLVSSCDKKDCAKKLAGWKEIVGADLFAKTYPAMGNHDRSSEAVSDKIWQEFFSLPENSPEGYEELTYSLDFRNSHFVILNSAKPDEHIVNKIQRDWLEKDLITTQKENVFILYHEPAWPVSAKIHESLDYNPSERDALWEIFKKHKSKIRAVFSGHEHLMSRKAVDGIYQFVIGNTSAFNHDAPRDGLAEYFYRGYHYTLVVVDGGRITVKIFTVEGKLLNSFSLP